MFCGTETPLLHARGRRTLESELILKIVYKGIAFVALFRYTGPYQSSMTASCTLVKGPVLTYRALGEAAEVSPLVSLLWRGWALACPPHLVIPTEARDERSGGISHSVPPAGIPRLRSFLTALGMTGDAP